MHGWAPYIIAFGIAIFVAIGGYLLGAIIAFSTSSLGMAGFFGVVFLAPLIASLAVFSWCYGRLSGKDLGWQGVLVGAAFVAVTAFICFILIAQRTLDETGAAALLVAVLFVGGRVMTNRVSDA